jgi:hypothetical protein
MFPVYFVTYVPGSDPRPSLSRPTAGEGLNCPSPTEWEREGPGQNGREGEGGSLTLDRAET